MLTPRALVASGTRSRLILCDDASRPRLVKATRLGDAPSAERARRECDLCSRALGDFVVASHGWLAAAGTGGPEVCLLFEFCPGGDLGLLLERTGTLGVPAARFYVGCAALALDHLHSIMIVHRDVKPSNIVIGADGYAKLADFGFARDLPPDGVCHTLLGTPDFMSPERLLCEGHSLPSDMYALGVTLYLCLVGAFPYDALDDSSADAEQPEPPALRAALSLRGPPFFPQNTVPRAATELVTALLQREPARRLRAGSLWLSPTFASDGPFARSFTHCDGPLVRAELLARAVAPPWVPKLRSDFDTALFRGAADERAAEAGAEAEACGLPDGAESVQRYTRGACTVEALRVGSTS